MSLHHWFIVKLEKPQQLVFPLVCQLYVCITVKCHYNIGLLSSWKKHTKLILAPYNCIPVQKAAEAVLLTAKVKKKDMLTIKINSLVHTYICLLIKGTPKILNLGEKYFLIFTYSY